MTLTDIVLEILNEKIGVSRKALDLYSEAKERCAEAKISVTEDEIKREFRAAAGFP